MDDRRNTQKYLDLPLVAGSGTRPNPNPLLFLVGVWSN